MDALIRWLLTEGRRMHTVPEVLAAFGQQVRRFAPVDRMWLGTKVLHPQAAAYLWIWRHGHDVVERALGYEVIERVDQPDSPVLRLRQGEPEIHFHAPDDDGMEDLRSVWDQGYVELFGDSIRFRDRWMGAVTWASKTGFSDADIQLFRDLNPALSAVLEPLAADLVTATLLRTYLGADAGDRVFQGQVKRGDGSSLRAVVWVSDVRGFTRLTEALGRDELLALLNDGFERVCDVVEAHHGQVLKFMGDGVLAVFPCDDGDDVAALRAREAALELTSQLAGLQRDPPIHMGIGLHLGEVSYGNIGSPGRLDFTVIGSAVNLAARVESQCSRLGATILATPQVARFGGWEGVDAVSMKGVAQPVQLFRPV